MKNGERTTPHFSFFAFHFSFEKYFFDHFLKHSPGFFLATGEAVAHGWFSVERYAKESRDALNAKCSGQFLLLIGIYLVYHYLSFVFLTFIKIFSNFYPFKELLILS